MNPGFALPCLFATALVYNGASTNLHWLAISSLLLLLWLSVLIVRLDVPRLQLAGGWLPGAALLYLFWLLVAPFLSAYPYAASVSAMTLAVLPLVLLGWLILTVHDKQTTWRLTWRLLLVCGVAWGIWGIVDAFVLHQRAHGSFIDANAYAALINLFLVPSAFLYLRTPASGAGFDKPHLLLGIVAVLTLAQFASLSRGALLSFAATLPWLLWMNRAHPAFRSRFALLLLVFASAYLLVKIAPIGQQQGIESFIAAPGQYVEKNAAIQERLLLLDSTWQMIKDSNPWIGAGLGTFKIHYAAYRDENESSAGNFAHNDYLQGLQEGGLIQLTFFLVFTVLAPVLMLRRGKSRLNSHESTDNPDMTPGLLLGIICVSLHALFNFVHFVYPIALLTGLYLARSWEVLHRERRIRLPSSIHRQIKPRLLKGLVIAIVAAPVFVLALDGIIFKFFATDDSLLARFDQRHRFVLLNASLAIRPANPMPRVMLIRQLLGSAEHSDSPDIRARTLEQAERETGILALTAPGLPIVHFYMGQIRALRGTPTELLAAREEFAHAVRLVPQATGMRLELVKIYQRLDQHKDAYQAVLEAKKWVRLEVDLHSLAAFAKEAEAVARHQRDQDEVSYWTWILAQLTKMGFVG